MKKVLLLITIVASFVSFTKAQISKADSLILVDFYNVNPNSKLHKSVDAVKGWDLSKTVDKWDGVSIKDSIISLFLGSKEIDSIPVTIGGIKNLSLLSLGNNKIVNIPSSLGSLLLKNDGSISSGAIFLGNNKITSIPEFLKNISGQDLYSISFSGNPITSLPEWLGSLNFSLIELNNLNINQKSLNFEFTESKKSLHVSNSSFDTIVFVNRVNDFESGEIVMTANSSANTIICANITSFANFTIFHSSQSKPYTLSTNCFETPTGYENISIDDAFKIYPNPSSGIFTLDSEKKDITIKVFNSIGNLLFTAVNVKEIDLTGNPNGLYNILVNGESQTVVKQ